MQVINNLLRDLETKINDNVESTKERGEIRTLIASIRILLASSYGHKFVIINNPENKNKNE